MVRQAGRFATTPEALRVFAASLAPSDEVALEATGNTHAIATRAGVAGGRVVVSNPQKTRAIAEAKVKTDKVDAAILAAAVGGRLPAGGVDGRRGHRGAAAAGARRAHLVRQRTRLKNQVQAILHRNLVAALPGRGPVRAQGPCAGWPSRRCPPMSEAAAAALLRQLDFHGEELRLIDAELGTGRAGPAGREAVDDDPRRRRHGRVVDHRRGRRLLPLPHARTSWSAISG